jgi:hypothetical protein
MASWYPKNIDALAAWYANFAAQLPALATKYGIAAATLTDVATDNAWIQYWVQARHDADNLKQQLTAYFNIIAGNDLAAEIPAPIDFVLPGTAPAEAKPGIEAKTRAIARQIKGDQDYSEADGELLGIVSSETGEAPESVVDFALKTLANFELQATFRKFGMDALKLQYRYKGGNWQGAGFLVSSPGTFAIAPQEPNTAEEVEIRAIYIQKNAEVGEYSDAKSAFIAG